MICTAILMEEHQTILRRLVVLANLLETPLTGVLGSVESTLVFFHKYVDEFHHLKEEEIYFAWMQDKDSFLNEDGPVLCMNKEHEIGRTLLEKIETDLALFKSGQANLEKSIKSNLYQYIAFLNDHIQKEDSAIYQVAESLNEKVQGGDAEMLPKFEQMAARYRETMREALEFEKSLVEESPRWLPPTP
ncbi:MAG: hemerythrin domain-containing protein [Bdellovibrionales bacterium]|nr:hemerythrin domain-containing protein [Bdellovibrionales bacterium]